MCGVARVEGEVYSSRKEADVGATRKTGEVVAQRGTALSKVWTISSPGMPIRSKVSSWVVLPSGPSSH